MAGIFGDAINNRAEFYEQLDLAEKQALALEQIPPNEQPLAYLGKQLASIRKMTAGGRVPTATERRGIYIGVVMYKEDETTDDPGVYAFSQLVGGIDAYIKHWPNDAAAADPDNDDYLFIP